MNLLLHPALPLLFSSLIMFLIRDKRKSLFAFLSIIFPFISIFFFLKLDSFIKLDIFSIHFIPVFKHNNCELIFYAFIFNLFIASVYSLVVRKYNEIILGNLYCASAIFGLLCGDFLSLFAAFEMMMIFSSLIIFISNYSGAKTAAVRYLLIHFIAGTLFISGASILKSFEVDGLKLITDYSNLFEINQVAAFLIFVSLIILSAGFPFSFWLSDGYIHASGSGIIILQAYTTKLAVFFLMLLFPGEEILFIIGILTFIYGITYAILEANLNKIACYLSVSKIGFFYLIVSSGIVYSGQLISALIIIEIISKELLLITFAALKDLYMIKYSYEMKKIYSKNLSYKTNSDIKWIFFSLIIFALSLISLPYSMIFKAKFLLSSYLENDFFVYIIYLSFSSLILLSIPWKDFYEYRYHNIKLPVILKILISFLAACLILVNFTLQITNHTTVINNNYYINQLLLILVSLLLTFVFFKNSERENAIIIDTDILYRTIFKINLLSLDFSQFHLVLFERIKHIYKKIIFSKKDFYIINDFNILLFFMILLTITVFF